MIFIIAQIKTTKKNYKNLHELINESKKIIQHNVGIPKPTEFLYASEKKMKKGFKIFTMLKN